MNLAWSSIFVFLLLAPGFLFLAGIYYPQQITRDVTAWRTPGQMSAIISVSLLVHSVYFGILSLLGILFNTEDYSLTLIVDDLLSHYVQSGGATYPITRKYIFWTLTYVFSASASGWLLGMGTGLLVIKGAFRFLVKHNWAYDLIGKIESGVAIAYVLTHVKCDNRHLMYKGGLKEFFIGPEGTISYLILTNAEKDYLFLNEEFPGTSRDRPWRRIETPNAQLFIEGEDIVNVIFSETPMKNITDDDYRYLEEEIKSSKKQIQDILVLLDQEATSKEINLWSIINTNRTKGKKDKKAGKKIKKKVNRLSRKKTTKNKSTKKGRKQL